MAMTFMNGSERSALVLPATFKLARFIDTAVQTRAGPFLASKISFAVDRRAKGADMNKAWPALASATYIGCAWITLEGCTEFDDGGLFATPAERVDASIATSGAGGTSTTSDAGRMGATTGTTSSAGATSTVSTGGGAGARGGAGGTGGNGGNGGGEGAGASGRGGSAGGGGAGGSLVVDGGAAAGGAGGSPMVDGGAGSTADAGVPKVCADLHAAARTAHETAQACTQAGSFTECRLVQDECGCGAGVRGAATQATQRYLMAVQTLKDNGCFDACPDAGCPPYTGVTCTPGTLSRLQCIAF
jgi:hypothetical protein